MYIYVYIYVWMQACIMYKPEGGLLEFVADDARPPRRPPSRLYIYSAPI